jgi:addiction module HigA family antidote
MLPKHRQPTHPGEILLNDFLEPMGRTQQDFANHLGWTYARVNEIVNGKRGVSEEAALCFADAFGTSPQFWLNLQANYDLWAAQQTHKKVKPLKSVAS